MFVYFLLLTLSAKIVKVWNGHLTTIQGHNCPDPCLIGLIVHTSKTFQLFPRGFRLIFKCLILGRFKRAIHTQLFKVFWKNVLELWSLFYCNFYRSWVGANSGVITQRETIMYEQREDQTTFVRVHTVPGMFDYINFKVSSTWQF